MPIAPTDYPARLVNGSNTITIPNGSTTSNIVQCAGGSIVGLFIPAAFTGSNLTFFASPDGSQTVYQIKLIDGSGNPLTIAVAAQVYQPLDPATFAGVDWLQIVSTSSQAGAQNLLLIMGPLWQ